MAIISRAIRISLSVMSQVCLFALLVFISGRAASTEQVKEACESQWRPEALVGKCFGLKRLQEYIDGGVSNIPSSVGSSDECKGICCNLGEKCVTWQFWDGTKECKIGGPVRLGLEGADNDNWCEPHAPRQWTGRKLNKRYPADDMQLARHPNRKWKCEWGAELRSQCYGLGPERLTKNPHEMAHFTGTEQESGGRMGARGCSRTCCQTEGCSHWQELPDRGCYHNNNETKESTIHCEQYTGKFFGGRKCVKKFCGGKETSDTLTWKEPFKSNWG